jgi:hypothetical protein
LIAASVACPLWPDWKWIVIVIAIFLVGQFVEGNILSPKLVGERVDFTRCGVDVRLRLSARLRRSASPCRWRGDRGAVPLPESRQYPASPFLG